jgi:hypothetical protein
MKLIDCSIGVLVVSGAVSLAIAPVLSLAQPADTLSLPVSDLPFTAQVIRLNQINAQTRSTLQAILTPTQLVQLEDALESDTDISQTALTALKLSPAQQTELMQILLSTQQPTDVLTPNQIEQARRSLPFHP